MFRAAVSNCHSSRHPANPVIILLLLFSRIERRNAAALQLLPRPLPVAEP